MVANVVVDVGVVVDMRLYLIVTCYHIVIEQLSVGRM